MYGGPSEFVRRIDYLVPDLRIGSFSRRGGHFVVVPSEEGVKELLIRAEAIGFRLKMFTEAAAKDKGKGLRAE